MRTLQATQDIDFSLDSDVRQSQAKTGECECRLLDGVASPFDLRARLHGLLSALEPARCWR